jgi:SulP family sulfate permease
MRREILAQGWANLAGAFGASFPASASFTRSALLRLGGARTRLAAAAGALFTVPILLFAGRAPTRTYRPS